MILSRGLYQAAKTLKLEQREKFLLNGVTPAMAKKMGRGVKLRPDWEEVKVGVATSPREAMNEALRTGVRNNWRLLRLDVQGGADHRLYGYSCTDIFVSEDYTKYMEYSQKAPLPYDTIEYGEIGVASFQ